MLEDPLTVIWWCILWDETGGSKGYAVCWKPDLIRNAQKVNMIEIPIAVNGTVNIKSNMNFLFEEVAYVS